MMSTMHTNRKRSLDTSSSERCNEVPELADPTITKRIVSESASASASASAGKEAIEIGKDEEKHNDEDERSRRTCSASGDIIREKTVSWQTARGTSTDTNTNKNTSTSTSTYTVEMKVEKYYDFQEAREINTTLYFVDREKKPIAIGRLVGTILPRPSPFFYAMGDDIDGELKWLTLLFCDWYGGVTRILTDLKGGDVYRGGFFHIRTVRVNKAHRGQDLGLRMVHEALVFLRGEWNLAVLVPRCLPGSVEDGDKDGDEDRLRIAKRCSASNDDDDDDDGEQNEDEKEDERDVMLKTLKIKIARHWARMGFRQAGRGIGKCDAWYMTSSTYFHFERKVSTPMKITSSMAMERWKTKDEIQSLDIFSPPRKCRPRGTDKELQKVVKQYMHAKSPISPQEFQDILHKIRDLVSKKNASVHNSRVLFTIAATTCTRRNKSDTFTLELLQTLLELSPDAVNATDENGNRPLHIASTAMNYIVIRILLTAGATPTAKNNEGYTPLKCLQDKRQESEDSKVVFPETYMKPDNVEPMLESLLLFMTKEMRDQLVDDWLPPRMMAMFVITAEVALDEIRDCAFRFDANHPTPLVECCFGYFEYIPKEVFEKNPQGFCKMFYDGWCILWEAILSLLQKNKAPTISHVEKEIQCIRADPRVWDHFVRRGGEVMYALDALINVTQNVYTGGGSWEYKTFKADIERHPETLLLDNAFDLAKVKCLEINHDNIFQQPLGPYEYKLCRNTLNS